MGSQIQSKKPSIADMKKIVYKSFAFFWLPAFIILILAGCRRDELCFFHPNDALIEFKIDWSRSALEPNSASAIIYKDGSYFRTEVFSVYPPVRKIVDLPVGNYSTVVMNEQMYEFEKYFHFTGIEKWHTLETHVLDDHQYDRASTRALKQEVDTLATDRILDFEITEDMIYKAHRHPTSKEDAENFSDVTHTLTFAPRRAFTAVSIILNVINGASYYFAPRNPPTLSGMSESFFPGIDRYSPNSVVHAINFTKGNRNTGSSDAIFRATLLVVHPVTGDSNSQLKDETELYKLILPFVYPAGLVSKEINLKTEARKFLFTPEDPNDRTNNWDKLEIEVDLELPEQVQMGDMDAGVEDWNDVDIPLDGPQRLHFVANNGSKESFWWTNRPGVFINLPEPLFSAVEGLTFKEWNSNADGTGTVFYPGDPYEMKRAGFIFYAIWNTPDSHP